MKPSLSVLDFVQVFETLTDKKVFCFVLLCKTLNLPVTITAGFQVTHKVFQQHMYLLLWYNNYCFGTNFHLNDEFSKAKELLSNTSAQDH